jgi:hypothetical protein
MLPAMRLNINKFDGGKDRVCAGTHKGVFYENEEVFYFRIAGGSAGIGSDSGGMQ